MTVVQGPTCVIQPASRRDRSKANGNTAFLNSLADGSNACGGTFRLNMVMPRGQQMIIRIDPAAGEHNCAAGKGHAL